ncbi:MAG: hypothetical protein M3096_05565 [Actinomycetia bacterium]|nr:hypothetical protein [Actinomycetes bacterium]
MAIRRLRPHHLEALYDQKLHPTNVRKPLAPKTVLEIHLIVRGALNDAVRRGIVTRNVAVAAHTPELRAIPKVEQHSDALKATEVGDPVGAFIELVPRMGGLCVRETRLTTTAAQCWRRFRDRQTA